MRQPMDVYLFLTTGNKKCPMCNSCQWKANSSGYGIPAIDLDGYVRKREILPSIIAECQNCGHMLFFGVN